MPLKVDCHGIFPVYEFHVTKVQRLSLASSSTGDDRVGAGSHCVI